MRSFKTEIMRDYWLITSLIEVTISKTAVTRYFYEIDCINKMTLFQFCTKQKSREFE